MECAARLRSLGGLTLLHGSSEDAGLSEFSFLTADPSYLLLAQGESTIRIERDGSRRTLPADILTVVAEALRDAKAPPSPEAPPFQGGFAGYIGYELAELVEPTIRKIPTSSPSRHRMPDAVLAWYDWVVAWDHVAGRTWLIADGDIPSRSELLAMLMAVCTAEDVPRPASRVNFTRDAWMALAQQCDLVYGTTRASFMDAVDRIRAYIRAGDIFQANLSQRFTTPAFDDPWCLFTRMAHRNPAPFSAFLDYSFGAIVSASPERFIRVSHSGHVETRPIKGTRPRSDCEEDDKNLSSELLLSAKDRAEHVMIVDVLRNDLGRACTFGSIEVSDLFRIERYASVHHLVSIIEGKLRSDCSPTEMLRSAFPGGSITGAPKVRAMEIIRELEPEPREIYCGVIGYLSVTGAVDTSIAIRTCWVQDGLVSFAAGGGIVADSDPESEYDETLVKAYPLLQAIRP